MAMDALVQDLRQGVRLLVREPAFAAVAITTLALGIGANTAMFGVINAVLLNPFPYKDADGILFLGQTFNDQPNFGSVPAGNFQDWAEQQQVFSLLAGIRSQDMSLNGADEPVQVHAGLVSASAFPMLGIEPRLGRAFRADEDAEGAPRAVVLSYDLWQSHFGADASILGRTLLLDDQSYTVVGVMPPRFELWAADLWVPYGLNFEGQFKDSRLVNKGLFGLARLKPGVSMAAARAAMSLIAKRAAEAHPDTNKGIGVSVTRLKDGAAEGLRPALFVLLASVGFVLLIACANVANLLLARAATRERELSVRAALGAGRGRLLVQMLTEALPLALLGGLLGALLAWWGLKGLLLVIPPDAIPAESDVRLDVRVLAFTGAVSILTALLFGLLPALQASRRDVMEGLKEGARGASGGRGRQRLRGGLIVAEVALSLVLLVGAGLLMKSFSRMRSADPGFRTHDVLKMEINLPERKYPNPEQSEAFFRQSVEKIRGLPGVVHAGMGMLPFSGHGHGMPLVIEGKTYQSIQELPFLALGLVEGEYFQALGIRLHSGRLFGAEDTSGSLPVTVVNRSLVRKHFAGQEPIGKRIKAGLPDNLNREGILPPGANEFTWLTIVGVVEDVKLFGLSQEIPPVVYLPFTQAPKVAILRNSWAIVVQASGDPLQLVGAVREQVWSLDRGQPIVGMGRMETLVADSLLQPRFGTLLLSLFAGIALVMALVGIYGLVSYSVAQRTREVGIRLALGAGTGDVLRLVLRQGMTLVAVGIVVGLAIAFALARFLGSLLYEVNAGDPLTFASVAVLLGLVALVACYFPARRATRVNPTVALRYE
jgi:putative ABC transport system permease protein